MQTLKGKTLFISGASRGIGKAIALRAAADGANIVVAAKTAEHHPKLPGFTLQPRRLGRWWHALPLVVDIRSEGRSNAVAAAVERFGGIDVLINNVSNQSQWNLAPMKAMT